MTIFVIFLLGYWTCPIPSIGDAILRFSLNFCKSYKIPLKNAPPQPLLNTAYFLDPCEG